MTNNRINNGYNRNDRRPTDRARAATRAKAKKQNTIIAVAAIALLTIIAGCGIGFSVFGAKNPAASTAPAVTAQVTSVDKELFAAPADSAQADIQQATAQPQTADQTEALPQTEQQSEDRIDTVNGERVYIDTKRQAPENAGTPAHYNAYGKTSYGFDWDYKTDNCNFVLRCDYNFDRQEYDFQFYGTEAGVAHVTLYYNTGDNIQVPVNLTVTVDGNLNASIA